MADETPPVETPDPAEAQKAAFKALFKESMTEFLEENKPAPKRTEKASGPLDWLLGG